MGRLYQTNVYNNWSDICCNYYYKATIMTIIITGGTGFLGQHLTALLQKRGYNPIALGSDDYNLLDNRQTQAMFDDLNPDYIFHLAATVGGIGANRNHPASFFYNNMTMGMNVIHEASRHIVNKLIVIGTTCSYPKFTPKPFNEYSLFDGYPEETNAPYGIAKRALLTMLRAYREEHDLHFNYLIPTNIYGPGDNFDDSASHVIPALIKKCLSEEPILKIWGTGKPTRDFIYVTDVAKALVLAMENYARPEPLNIGSGHEISIDTLLHFLVQKTRFCGKIQYDLSKPDGQPRRVLNIRAIKNALGWEPEVNLQDGLQMTIDWYKEKR